MFNFLKWLLLKYKMDQKTSKEELPALDIEITNSSLQGESKQLQPNYNGINKIVLTTPDSSQLTEFLKILPSTIEHKEYKFLSTSNISNLATSPMAGIIQGTAIKALASNGLYTATVAPELLMKYTDGTIASMMKEGGKFVAHAGFTTAEAAVFAPLIVYQVLSIITSQYYLNGINKQLTAIQNSLDKLRNLNYSGDEGKLFSIQETLSSIITSKQPLKEEISLINICKKESLEIAAKYLSMLNKQYAPEKTKCHLDEKKRLEEIKEEIYKTDGEFYMNMAYTAYFLSSLSDIALLYVLSFYNKNENYNIRIQDHLNKMDISWSEHEKNYIEASKRFYSSFDLLIEKYKEKWPNDYQKDIELNQRLEEYKNYNNDVIQKIKKSPCIELKNKVKKYLETPKEVLICIDENGQQYMLQENN